MTSLKIARLRDQETIYLKRSRKSSINSLRYDDATRRATRRPSSCADGKPSRCCSSFCGYLINVKGLDENAENYSLKDAFPSSDSEGAQYAMSTCNGWLRREGDTVPRKMRTCARSLLLQNGSPSE